MGGGAAMRAASKVATYGITAGIRGVASIPLPEQSLPAASRNVSKAMVSTSDDVKSRVLIGNKDDGKRCWDKDEWEFASVEVSSDTMDPMPRVVFGGVPSLEEAMEATQDLKQALDKEYFSNAIHCKESTLLKSGHSETKACITSENAVVHSALPKPVFQAFSLLKESPEAQGVVASLASDKNVWNAVMHNEKVMEFIKKQQTSVPADIGTDIKETFQVNKNVMEEETSEVSGNEFLDFIEKLKVKVKITVSDIVSGLSGFFQNIFVGPSEDDNVNVTVKGSMMGASFMALAVLTIMVAVLKRG